MQDWARLFAWRNDPITRESMLSRGEVPLQDHLRWMSETLAKETVRLFIACDEDRGVPVGTARLDLRVAGSSTIADVSLTVDPRQRGRGLAEEILAMLEAEARTLGVTRLIATVKVANHASLRAFADAGYGPPRPEWNGGDTVDLERLL